MQTPAPVESIWTASAAGLASVLTDMPPKKSGRPARPVSASRPLRQRPSGSAVKTGTASQTGTAGKIGRAGRVAEVSKTGTGRGRPVPQRSGGRPTRREPAGEVVLGSIPGHTRVVGGVGVLGGLLLAVAVVLPHLSVGGQRVVLGDSVTSTLVSWIWPVVIAVAGTSVVLGRYPRLGMAALGVAGAVSVAGLLGELYWASQAAARGRYEIIAGRRLLTSEVEPLSGWYVGVAGLSLLVLAGLAVGWSWSRVVMDDTESLDPGRPLLGGLAAVSGVAAVLSLGATLVQIPDQVSVTQQPVAGQLRPVQNLIPVEGAIGLFDRPGLALAAGLVLSGVLVLFSVYGTTLRPRLAVVGALAAFAGYVVALAARALFDAARSDQIESTVGGWGLLLVGLAYAGLTVLAWRWQPPVRPISRGLPMRPASRRALKDG